MPAAKPKCPDCGGPMTSGETSAILCGTFGGVRLPLPDWCASRACQEARDERAIQDAIARGVINP